MFGESGPGNREEKINARDRRSKKAYNVLVFNTVFYVITIW